MLEFNIKDDKLSIIIHDNRQTDKKKITIDYPDLHFTINEQVNNQNDQTKDQQASIVIFNNEKEPKILCEKVIKLSINAENNFIFVFMRRACKN